VFEDERSPENKFSFAAAVEETTKGFGVYELEI